MHKHAEHRKYLRLAVSFRAVCQSLKGYNFIGDTLDISIKAMALYSPEPVKPRTPYNVILMLDHDNYVYTKAQCYTCRQTAEGKYWVVFKFAKALTQFLPIVSSAHIKRATMINRINSKVLKIYKVRQYLRHRVNTIVQKYWPMAALANCSWLDKADFIKILYWKHKPHGVFIARELPNLDGHFYELSINGGNRYYGFTTAMHILWRRAIHDKISTIFRPIYGICVTPTPYQLWWMHKVFTTYPDPHKTTPEFIKKLALDTARTMGCSERYNSDTMVISGYDKLYHPETIVPIEQVQWSPSDDINNLCKNILHYETMDGSNILMVMYVSMRSIQKMIFVLLGRIFHSRAISSIYHKLVNKIK